MSELRAVLEGMVPRNPLIVGRVGYMDFNEFLADIGVEYPAEFASDVIKAQLGLRVHPRTLRRWRATKDAPIPTHAAPHLTVVDNGT